MEKLKTKYILTYNKGKVEWNEDQMKLEDWWELFELCVKKIRPEF